MAVKKYYGVKKGKITGVFKDWEHCRESVEGFPNAEYKGFATYEEVCAYLGIACEESSGTVACGQADTLNFRRQPGDADSAGCGMQSGTASSHLRVYVDGSYDDSLKKYAFGCVFLLPDGRIYTEFGNGDNPQSLKHRNVTGEMLGAMYAVKTAMMNGYSQMEICYDYEGIEKWVTGAWKSKTELTRKYGEAMRDWSRGIQIRFTKVPAHSNVKYNELADRLAKRGLKEGEGVPKVRRLEDMERYGTDEAE